MNAEQLMGLKVVGSEDGTTIGTVKGLLISQDEKRLVALEVGGGILSHSLFVPFESVKSVEHDVVMVPSSESLVDRQNLASEGLTGSLAKRQVFTEDGKNLGTVHGYSIDPQTGKISSMTLAVDKEVLGGLWSSAGDSYDISGELIKTLGDNVVVDGSVPERTGMSKAA
jgi:sporulation protein YlmC with PRC-barrel domain